MRGSRLTNVVLAAMLVVGVGLLLYPTVSDWWNSSRQSQAISNYVEISTSLGDSRREYMLSEARAYNEELSDHVVNGELDEVFAERYSETLDVSGTGIMGYVKIPTLRVTLPIYHGTDESVLQVAIGHLEWSSLPVGGEGTHSVVSGHRGLPSAKLFTSLDKMVEGDAFELHVLDEVYAYEVDQILIVDPSEVGDLQVIPGEDLCTLVTCTPYGINTHRLLVRGHRVDASAVTVVPNDATRVDSTMVTCVIAVPLLIAAVALLLAGDSRKRRKREALAKVTASKER